MTNPVLVEVSRGPLVESVHRGSYVVMDGGGDVVSSAGDVDRPVFPRSAIKVFQAIPLIESGAADRFSLTDADLALACASHSGEVGHVQAALGMLERAGLDGSALECGVHWPFDLKVTIELARSGAAPTALHNNCSGKHAGFLCTAVHEGEVLSGYVQGSHPVQERAKAVIEDLTGSVLGEGVCGTDGCSIPTYAAPLKGFAYGFAKLVTGRNVERKRAEAGQRLIAACMAHPWEMSGTDRACLTMMNAAPGRLFVKTGAEGVFCGAIPEMGLGFALKIDDGTTRASEALCAKVVADCLRERDCALARTFDGIARTTLRNWEKTPVGEIRPVV